MEVSHTPEFVDPVSVCLLLFLCLSVRVCVCVSASVSLILLQTTRRSRVGGDRRQKPEVGQW